MDARLAIELAAVAVPHAKAGWGRLQLWAGPLLLLGALACEGATGPTPVSYLAIVTLVDAPPGISPGARYSYRVREVSGTLDVDSTVVAPPRDTLILPLPPATYGVSLSGLPAWCTSRHGADQFLVVLNGPSTSLARYHVSCRAPLTVRVFSEGPDPDDDMVYRLTGPGGVDRIGIVHANDTLHFDDLDPGSYALALSLVDSHCVVISDGGTRAHVTVPPGGGAELDLRVVCSDEARRPRMLQAGATFRGGVGGFTFRAYDPDRDLERYVWDLTDCQGTSVLSGAARTRRGLSSGRTRGMDTVTVVGAFEVADSQLLAIPACTALRLADEQGNTTRVLEIAIRPPASSAPRASTFNAFTLGTTSVRTVLEAEDADGDFVGAFAAARVRDGVLFSPDGQPDLGIYNVAGYLGNVIPDLPLGSRIQYGDVYAVIIYLVDAAGNVTRLEDVDVLR